MSKKVQKTGYSMQINKPKVTNGSNFNNKAETLMSESSMYMLGKSKSTDPEISTIELEGVTVTGKKPPSKVDDVVEYESNLEDARHNIWTDIYENIHLPDSAMAQIGRKGVTYKVGYDHRYASDYTSSDANYTSGSNNIKMGRGTNQEGGAPSFEFEFTKSDKVSGEKKGTAMQGGSSGQWAMIRQYDAEARKRFAEKKAEIQKNFPKLNFKRYNN